MITSFIAPYPTARIIQEADFWGISAILAFRRMSLLNCSHSQCLRVLTLFLSERRWGSLRDQIVSITYTPFLVFRLHRSGRFLRLREPQISTGQVLNRKCRAGWRRTTQLQWPEIKTDRWFQDSRGEFSLPPRCLALHPYAPFRSVLGTGHVRRRRRRRREWMRMCIGGGTARLAFPARCFVIEARENPARVPRAALDRCLRLRACRQTRTKFSVKRAFFSKAISIGVTPFRYGDAARSFPTIPMGSTDGSVTIKTLAIRINHKVFELLKPCVWRMATWRGADLSLLQRAGD